MLEYLSAGQLFDWQCYAEQFGIGIDRDDIHHGMLLSMFFNVNRPEGTSPMEATEFMPYYQHEPEDISAEDFANQIKGLLRGKIERGTTPNAS